MKEPLTEWDHKDAVDDVRKGEAAGLQRPRCYIKLTKEVMYPLVCASHACDSMLRMLSSRKDYV